MKIKTVKYWSKKNFFTQGDSKSILILLFVFAAAMVIGAGTAGKSDTLISMQLNEYIDSSFAYCVGSGFAKVFIYSFLLNFITILFAFVNGFNCIGMPFSVVLPAVKGIGLGLISGALYSSGTDGFIKYCMTIFPGGIFSVLALILACNESSYMSVDILSLIMNKREITENISLKEYSIKFIVIMILALISSLIDSVALAGIGRYLSV